MSKNRLLNKLAEVVINFDINHVEETVRNALEENIEPWKAIKDGLGKGMKIVGDKFDKGEYFLPELMGAADAMKVGLNILTPMLRPQSEKKMEKIGTILIGTVEGDIHDIGKNLVAAMLTAEGFDVRDLGRDVPTNVFIEKVREIRPDILGLSALLSTTMMKQKVVIEALEEAGLRDKVKVIVGGSPVNQKWAEKIGADAYCPTAPEATKTVKKLLEIA